MQICSAINIRFDKTNQMVFLFKRINKVISRTD